jgi:hypothetical protein
MILPALNFTVAREESQNCCRADSDFGQLVALSGAAENAKIAQFNRDVVRRLSVILSTALDDVKDLMLNHAGLVVDRMMMSRLVNFDISILIIVPCGRGGGH